MFIPPFLLYTLSQDILYSHFTKSLDINRYVYPRVHLLWNAPSSLSGFNTLFKMTRECLQVLQQTQMIALKNCARYSECLPNKEKMSRSTVINLRKKFVFVPVIFSKQKGLRVNEDVRYLPFHVLELHIFDRYLFPKCVA